MLSSSAKMHAVLIACATCLTMATQAHTTWYVDDAHCTGPGKGTEADPCCLIQARIAATMDRDECVVAPDTCFETINFSGRAVTPRSTKDAELTTINGAAENDSVVICVSGEGPGTVLDGFTITGGDPEVHEAGGEMRNSDSGLIVGDCTSKANTGFGTGGMAAGGSSTMTNCPLNSERHRLICAVIDRRCGGFQGLASVEVRQNSIPSDRIGPLNAESR